MLTLMAIQWVAFPTLAFCLVAAAIRLARGPDAVDRVVAFDLIAVTLTGFIVNSALFYEKMVLLDMMIVLTLLSFLGTVGFAVFLEKAGSRHGD